MQNAEDFDSGDEEEGAPADWRDNLGRILVRGRRALADFLSSRASLRALALRGVHHHQTPCLQPGHCVSHPTPLTALAPSPAHRHRQGDAGALDGNVAYAHEHSRMVGHAEEEEHLAKRLPRNGPGEASKPVARRGRAKVDQEVKARRKIKGSVLQQRQAAASERFRAEEQRDGQGVAALRALARFHRADPTAFARRFMAAAPADRRGLVEPFVKYKGGGGGEQPAEEEEAG